MAVHLLTDDVPLFVVFEEMSETRARLNARPYTVAFAVEYDAFLDEWKVVHEQDCTLLQQMMAATAAVAFANANANVLIDDVDRAVRTITQGSRTAPLYVKFFDDTPSSIKETTLVEKVGMLAAWILGAKEATDPTQAALLAMAPRMQTVLDSANTALAAKAAAVASINSFKTTGARRALYDQANAIRKDTDGKLSRLARDRRDLNLSNTFADEFFRPAVGRSKTPTLDQIDAAISAKNVELANLQALRGQTLGDLNAAAQAQADADAASELAAENKRKSAEAKALARKSEKEASDKAKAAKKMTRKVKGRKPPTTPPPATTTTSTTTASSSTSTSQK